MTTQPKLEFARQVELALSQCLNKDGSWTDMPASYKRTLLSLANAQLDEIDRLRALNDELAHALDRVMAFLPAGTLPTYIALLAENALRNFEMARLEECRKMDTPPSHTPIASEPQPVVEEE